MLTSIALDALLTLIILMMVPLGLLRGGIREVCTTAGLLLGILMAQAWSGRLASLLTRMFDMSDGAARFAGSVFIVVLVAGIVGYGGSAAFSWRPGPGGRMYGAYLALLNAVVFVGFLINTYIDAIFDGEVPDTIERAWVSKAVSVGFEWVLLAGAVGIVGATLFGMLVRERSSDENVTVTPSAEEFFRVRYEQPQPQVRPLNEPEEEARSRPAPTKPVRIREVRHWEDEPAEPEPKPRYGSGWRQTWPDDRREPSRPAPSGTSPHSRSTSQQSSNHESGRQRDVLRDWMRSDKDSGNDG